LTEVAHRNEVGADIKMTAGAAAVAGKTYTVKAGEYAPAKQLNGYMKTVT
jgi:hypothetical protein